MRRGLSKKKKKEGRERKKEGGEKSGKQSGRLTGFTKNGASVRGNLRGGKRREGKRFHRVCRGPGTGVKAALGRPRENEKASKRKPGN